MTINMNILLEKGGEVLMICLYDVYRARLVVEVCCANRTELDELAKEFNAKVEVSHQNIFFVSFSDTESMDSFLQLIK